MAFTEKSLIERVRARAGRGKGVVLGMGDDCAILKVPAGQEMLVTTDFSLEGVHFRREWHAPEVVGWRCLTRGLSDIAAMGGEPVAAFLSLGLPREIAEGWVDRFFAGFLELAAEFNVTLAGGDTAESEHGILADIVVVGSAPKGKAIRRSGARVGDRIYVTGELGGSAAMVERLYAGRRVKSAGYSRYFKPVPRVAVGRWLRERGAASAMIDTSDGLSTDLGHICEESGVGAELNAELIPRAVIAKAGGEVDLRLALHGGEDYELLFTVRKNKRVPERIAGVRITEIGRIVRESGMQLAEGGVRRRLEPGGWEHFKRNS
ncbi:MAG TPA: thiamine-phosphate kinase [Terriglobales bacterium]